MTYRIPIYGLETIPGRERVFHMDTQGAYCVARLDCASFFHGIYVSRESISWEESDFFPLQERECWEMVDFLEDLEGRVCLSLNPGTGEYHFAKSECGKWST